MSEFDMDDLLEDLPEEQAQQLRDVSASVLAGLDQARSELRMPWSTVSWKRMKQLADRLAVETVDYTAAEGLLVGTWMAASSRTQLKAAQDEQDRSRWDDNGGA